MDKHNKNNRKNVLFKLQITAGHTLAAFEVASMVCLTPSWSAFRNNKQNGGSMMYFIQCFVWCIIISEPCKMKLICMPFIKRKNETHLYALYQKQR